MIVFLDVETSGIPPKGAAWDHPEQPHILSIGAVAFTDDGSQEVFTYYTIIKPTDFVIDNNCGAVQVNGITQETAMAYGIRYKAAIAPVEHICYKADRIVIYNAEFEAKMFAIEQRRAERKTEVVPRNKTRCLMLAMSEIIGEPGMFNGEFKWQKFGKAYHHIYGEDPKEQHHALSDARQSAWLTFEVVRQKLWNLD